MHKFSLTTLGHRAGCRMEKLQGFLRYAGGAAAALFLVQAASAEQTVTLAWNRNLESNVNQYLVYWGNAAGTYTSATNAGNATNLVVRGLQDGRTYYFVVTARNTAGAESDPSNEISYVTPSPPASVRLRSMTANQARLRVTGSVGRTYDVLAAANGLSNWTTIGAGTVNTNGYFDFTDTNRSRFPNRFYRTRDR